MKIQIISDLHNEFGTSNLKFENIDMLIVAGDLDLGIKGITWLKEITENIPIIYVLGNHEYYKGSYPKTLNKIKSASLGTNIHVLENESVVINNITFHGATLWTDFELFGNPQVYGSICQAKMNDYRLIRLEPTYSKLRSIDTYQMHKKSLNWLENSLSRSDTPINVVITHHAPSMKSIPDEFKEDMLSSAYASDLEPIILKRKPDFWIHGHIHTPIDYKIGSTRVICNPHGYIHEKYNGYNTKLIIEI
ncbi:MAG: metallophosphoesterase [Tannerella sp.]|jgi:Icc-related predicted phosphoesterase|nr:metallophosphoesterase [Tannerella sp.]